MITSLVHHPCEVALHLVSEDVFIHPPPPSSDYPGHDKTLAGLVEVRCPSARTIPGVKVELQGIQTLAFPEAVTPSYSPVWMRLIMSSDEAPSFVATVQPVAAVNSSVSWA